MKRDKELVEIQSRDYWFNLRIAVGPAFWPFSSTLARA
jgi:hypothetical protein